MTGKHLLALLLGVAGLWCPSAARADVYGSGGPGSLPSSFQFITLSPTLGTIGSVGPISLNLTEDGGPTGRVAAAGDAFIFQSSVGTALPNSGGARDDLIVQRNVELDFGSVPNGNIRSGGAYFPTGATGNYVPGNPLDFAALKAFYDQASSYYGHLADQGVALKLGASAAGGLVLVGNNSTLNVFNLNTSDIGNYAYIEVPASSTVIVNLHGTSADLFNFGGDNYAGRKPDGSGGFVTDTTNPISPSHILFNFPDATDVEIGNALLSESILAPLAYVHFDPFSATDHGSIVANTLYAQGEGLSFIPFEGTLPNTVVPEPSSLALLALGGAALAGWRRWQKTRQATA